MKYTVILLMLCARLAWSQSSIEEQILTIQKEHGVHIGVTARELHSGRTIDINGDSLFPTASIIKLPVLVELFFQFHDKKLSQHQPVMLLESERVPGSGIIQFLTGGQTLQLVDLATLMIILSDNTATNYVIDQLGTGHEDKLNAVNNRMKSLGLQHTKLLNKLYSYATKKKTEESQRFGIGVSTPNDMALLLETLVRCIAIDSSSSSAVIGLLRNQQDRQMAARFLPFGKDSTLWIANKTGSLDDVKNDVGIIGSSNGTFVYAIFCDNAEDKGEQIDNEAALAVARSAKLLYEYFLGKE